MVVLLGFRFNGQNYIRYILYIMQHLFNYVIILSINFNVWGDLLDIILLANILYM